MRWSAGRQNVALSGARWNVLGLDWRYDDLLVLLRLMLLGSCSCSFLETSQVPDIERSEDKESRIKGGPPQVWRSSFLGLVLIGALDT